MVKFEFDVFNNLVVFRSEVIKCVTFSRFNV